MLRQKLYRFGTPCLMLAAVLALTGSAWLQAPPDSFRFHSLAMGVEFVAMDAKGDVSVDANLLTNGSFELPSLPSSNQYEYVPPGDSTAITGWLTILNGVERGDLILNGVPGTTGTSQDGVLAIDLAPLGFTGGGIQQDFATTPGTMYHVSFYGSTLEGAGRDGTGQIDVSIGSTSQSFNVVNQTLNLTWTQFGFDFIATGTTSTLRFENNQVATLHFALVDNVEVIRPDDDGDGVPNDVDECPNSDLSATVVIDSCDSGVSNTLFPSGCTISDLIAECAEGSSNHGQFVSCVSHVTKHLKEAGIITGQQKGAIQSCAAHANIP